MAGRPSGRGARSWTRACAALAIGAALAEPSLAVAVAAAPEDARVEGARLSSGGELTIEARAFEPGGPPGTYDRNVGLFGRLQGEAGLDELRARGRGFGRVDARDARRSLTVIEELWGELTRGPWGLRIGADVLNWSATEAFHPADIVNAQNLDGDVERLEKVGEPMVAVSYRWRGGGLTGYVFPYRSDPVLPSRASRTSPIPRDLQLGSFVYLDASGELTSRRLAVQPGLLLQQTFGHRDVTLHVVHHTDRLQPEVILDPTDGTLHPLLRTVTQVGGTYQQSADPFIFKLEWGYRRFVQPRSGALGALPRRDHLDVATGGEWSRQWGAVEGTLVLEAESIFLVDRATRQALQPFQRDALAGVRVAFGDAASTTLATFAIIDLEDPGQVLWNTTLVRRVLEEVELTVAVRLVFGRPPAPAIGVPPDSDHVQLLLRRFF